MKRLYRSYTDKKVAGICGGLGVYLDVDPTIIRLAVVVIALLTAVFPALIGYVIAWIIIPEAPAAATD